MDINQDIALLRLRQPLKLNKPGLPLKGKEPEPAEYNRQLQKAADDFESLFVHQLLKIMRNSVPKSHFISGGQGEEIFQDMLDEHYAKLITENRAFGLSQMIYEQNKK